MLFGAWTHKHAAKMPDGCELDEGWIIGGGLAISARAGSQCRGFSPMDFDQTSSSGACPDVLDHKSRRSQGYFAERCRADNHQMTHPLQPSPHRVSVRWF